MIKKTVFTVALVAGAAQWSALAAPDLSKLPPASTQTGVTFEKDIQPMLQASCVRCHGEQRPRANLRLDSLEGVLKGSKDGKVVTVGDSTKSQIVIAASQIDPESAMPPKPRPMRPRPNNPDGTPNTNNAPPRPMGPPTKPLTPEQVGLLRAWIDQGAK